MDLQGKVEEYYRLTKRQKSALEKLRIFTVEDLLRHLPSRHENLAGAKLVADAVPRETASFFGQIVSVEKRLSWKTRKYVVEATFQDKSGELQLMWFNQVYIEKMLQNKPFVKVTGKLTGKRKLYIANPNLEFLPSLPEFIDGESEEFMPVYGESAGITSRWFYHAIRRALSEIDPDALQDPVPSKILQKYNLPSLYQALVWAHFPKKESQKTAATKRFAFEEVFALQTLKQSQKEALRKEKSASIKVDDEALAKLQDFVKSYGFELTGAQKRAIDELVQDFAKPYPAQRLLEGDVGSGKTAVAAAGAFLVYSSKSDGNKYKSLQTAYMAPTEILANQIFDDFIKFFENYNLKIALVTSSGCKIFPSKTEKGATKISCTQVKKWIKEGIVPIVVGTHSLIFKSVEFENLSFVIVDEQHRFGTMQRAKLSRKDGARPHFLSMSATPIPRTLALTIYGDLELSVLDELPAGRKEIKTKIVRKSARSKVYDFIKEELKKGRQAYVICPRIEEPDPEKANALRAKSVEEELKRLQTEVFTDYKLAPLHGKMKPKEKDAIMQKFVNGEIDILVATSVVEVGVNVPNATSIIIEGAERFGLSQLHQLRGRVRRSTHEAYCFLFTESSSQKTMERLKALEQSRNGFELAESDLKLRGPGDLYGSKQWGLSDIGMQALQNLKMVEYARKEALKLVKQDPELKSAPILKDKISKIEKSLHLE